jgi:hypothetical protein
MGKCPACRLDVMGGARGLPAWDGHRVTYSQVLPTTSAISRWIERPSNVLDSASPRARLWALAESMACRVLPFDVDQTRGCGIII